ncbi:MAG: BACON domain-containing protein, partial [Flavobacteriales bacterium]|nr:BACON domain-containing protein [Flavobacteriales bacterium]
MKNRLLTYMMALVVSFVVASCSKGEDPFLQAGPARIEIAANATSATFAISSNVQWTISSSDTWATVSPTSGQGNATINITSQTQTTHSSRSMTFTIKSKDVPEGGATVTLTQKEAPNELPTAPVLTSPANGETIAGLVPTFTWQASQDANGDAIAYT